MSEVQPLIYQTENGAIELRGDQSNETLWATQKQLAELFSVDVRTINEHIKTIFKTKELAEDSAIRKFRITATDGKSYNTNHYSLDMMISVGYRVNSAKATKFRRWATETLKQHITKGYTLNRSRIEQNYHAFSQAIKDLKTLANNSQSLATDDVLSLVTAFAQTWFSLESYDEDRLPKEGITHQTVTLEATELYQAVEVLKQDLIKKRQATPLFAQEKTKDGLRGILGSIYQSAFGQDAYPTTEEKAANLLYFIIKNHPFNDGNKRTGAFSFIWFLHKTSGTAYRQITPETLTALTLLIAESDPKSKDRMIGLLLLLLTGGGNYE